MAPIASFRFALTTCLLSAIGAAASAGQPASVPLPLRYGVEDATKPIIEIIDWKCDFGGTLVKLAWAARSHREKVAVGSFGIRVDERPGDFAIPGTETKPGRGNRMYTYFKSPEDAPEKASTVLFDNGALDLDKREGFYAVNIDTKGYKPGRYAFMVYSDNRPAVGPYAADSRSFAFEITEDGALRAPESRQALPGMENSVLYMKEGVYAVFPSLAARPDGRWIVTFGTKAVRDHLTPSGNRGGALISDDEGRTWAPTNEKRIYRMDLAKDGKKMIQVAGAGMIHRPESERARLIEEGRLVRDVSPGRIAYSGGLVKRISTDGGETWTKEDIPLPDVSGLGSYHHAARSITTREGVRLSADYGKRIVTDADGKKSLGNDEVFIFRSEDDGESWSFVPLLPRPPDSYAGKLVGAAAVAQADERGELGFNEPAIAQAADGTVFLMMRTLPEWGLWTSRSTDLGKTWSKPVDSGVKGYPASMITLADGRILCCYGYRYPPMGIRAVITADGGLSWSEPIVLRDDGMGVTGDLGYPLSLQRADGKVFTVYYMTTDGANTHIASTVWDPAAVAK